MDLVIMNTKRDRECDNHDKLVEPYILTDQTALISNHGYIRKENTNINICTKVNESEFSYILSFFFFFLCKGQSFENMQISPWSEKKLLQWK